jgi:hypothetical protein
MAKIVIRAPQGGKAMIDIEESWDLIYDLWNELDLEHVLAEIWPVECRWQLDLLAGRIERMDEAVILADPQKYPGLPQEWEHMFLTRHNWEKSRLMRALSCTPRAGFSAGRVCL